MKIKAETNLSEVKKLQDFLVTFPDLPLFHDCLALGRVKNKELANK